MARKRRRQVGEFEGALCGRCGMPLHEHEGTCPNDRCPFHSGYQDEVVTNDQWPSEEEWQYIQELRARLDREG